MAKYVINTDGGCSPNPGDGGAAWTILKTVEDKKDVYVERNRFFPATTNNRMEITAVIGALLDVADVTAEVVVRTDSKYVVDCISKWTPNWIKNQWKKTNGSPVENAELLYVLYRLVARFSNIRFEHVKGHTGDNGNERADELVKEAIYRGKTLSKK